MGHRGRRGPRTRLPLTTPDRLRRAIETSGFEIEHWNDLTDQAAATMQTLLRLPPSPIGLQAFVPNFESKARNLTAALADGRLRAIQGIARAVRDVPPSARPGSEP